MTLKHRKSRKGRTEAPRPAEDPLAWSTDREFDGWLDPDATAEFEPEEHYFPLTSAENGFSKQRLEMIKESHAFLKQFTPRELKVLIDLKRNTSPKAWTLREDLVVLTLPLSNREIADILEVTLGTVKIRLHRARAALKEALESNCQYYWLSELGWG